MSWITISRTIEAPVERVFDNVAHVENFRKSQPAIVGIEFLSETHQGVGTRFRETRKMGKRTASTELEVTEYVPHERVRLVSDAFGTVWDTVFHVRPAASGGTELELIMDARPHRLLARLMNPLIKGVMRKELTKDMDAVKVHCEQPA